jgi:hypothetical protein
MQETFNNDERDAGSNRSSGDFHAARQLSFNPRSLQYLKFFTVTQFEGLPLRASISERVPSNNLDSQSYETRGNQGRDRRLPPHLPPALALY